MKIKSLIVGLALLAMGASHAFAVTEKDYELAALKSKYDLDVQAAKDEYNTAVTPLKTSLADLKVQKSSLTGQKKAAMTTRKTNKAAHRDEIKSRKQTECKDPRTQSKDAVKQRYTLMKADCKTQYPNTVAPDGSVIVNPGYASCLGQVEYFKEQNMAAIQSHYEACVNNMNTQLQAYYEKDDTEVDGIKGQLEELNAKMSSIREETGSIKDSYSAKVEELKTSYEAAVAAVEAKYAEPAPADSTTTSTDSVTTTDPTAGI